MVTPEADLGSGTATTSKMELFVIIVNGWKPLTIITKSSILDVVAVLYPPLHTANTFSILSRVSFSFVPFSSDRRNKEILLPL